MKQDIAMQRLLHPAGRQVYCLPLKLEINPAHPLI